MTVVCDHWSGATSSYCGSTENVVRYLPGHRCPEHAPGAQRAAYVPGGTRGESGTRVPNPEDLRSQNDYAGAGETRRAVADSERRCGPDGPDQATSERPLGDCALDYVEQLGWRVFPLRPRGKEPFERSNGVRDATRDPDRIRAWWKRWPEANIGVACGPDSICCLDIDSKGVLRGEYYADAAQAAGLLDGWIAELRTPSGGRHLWYPGSNAPGGALGKTRDLEFKAGGGYVLLPPSTVLNKDGTTGTYEIVARKDEGWPLDWPRLRDFCQPPRAPRPAYVPRPGQGATFEGLIKTVADQGPTSNNRNNALHWAACAAFKQDAPGHILDAIAAAAISNGLPGNAVWATIRSAARGVTK